MLASLAERSVDLVEVVGAEGQRKWTSPSLQAFLGQDAEQLVDSSLLSAVHPDDQASAEELLACAASNPGEPVRGEYRLQGSTGRTIHADVIALNLFSVAEVAGIVLTSRDVTERVRRERKTFDSVTGLPNRVLFLDHLDTALRWAKAEPGRVLAVLSLDLDRFKVVNEGLGHDAGDELLRAVARRLESCLGPRDTVARPGSDEFNLLFTGLSDADESRVIADRVHQALADPFMLDGNEIYTTASIGIATSAKGYDQAAHMLRDAETAMNRAKSAGARNETFRTVMHIEALKQVQLDTDIRRAIDREEFFVEYQPIVHLETGLLAGFEALVRWNHPEEGLVSPGEFIPVAEETGLIAPIDRWVLAKACEAGAAWSREWRGEGELSFSVNVSSKQFSGKDLVDHVEGVLRDSGIRAEQLKLEITESAIMESPEAALEILVALQDLGVRLALDDFGTGYSSLSYLHRFPFNTLKIDRSFISRLGQPGEQLDIVQTIVTLAHIMKMDLVAEGIEDLAQWELLQSLGCQYGQGYFFARPLSVSDALDRVREPNFR